MIMSKVDDTPGAWLRPSVSVAWEWSLSAALVDLQPERRPTAAEDAEKQDCLLRVDAMWAKR
jgi:hypothetical protein